MEPAEVLPETLEQWMAVAVDEARKGIAKGQNPFGAAIYTPDGQQIARACNEVIARSDPSAHAEVMAIRSACQTLGETKLADHWLIATGEPCVMCSAVALTAGIRHIAFGADGEFIGNMGFDAFDKKCEQVYRFAGVKLTVQPYVFREPCESMMRSAK